MVARIVDREERKNQILAAARTLFIRKGIDRTTISEIAAEAKIGKGTVYEYFESKERLVLTLLESFFSYFDNQIPELPPVEGCTPEMFLGLFFSLLVSHPDMEEDISIFFEAMAMGKRGEIPEIIESMGEWFDTLSRVFVPYIRELQKNGFVDKKADPFQLIRTLFAFLDGAMLHLYLLGKVNDTEEMKSWESYVNRLVWNYLFCLSPQSEELTTGEEK